MIVQLHSTTRPTSATCNDHPAASYDSTDVSFPLRSSNCIRRLDRHQLPATIIQLHPTTRPTSASRYDRPAAFNDSTDSYPHQTSSCISMTRPTPAPRIGAHLHTFINLTINCHFSYICYLPFPSLSLAVNYSHALNLKHLRGRRTYRLRNKPPSCYKW